MDATRLLSTLGILFLITLGHSAHGQEGSRFDSASNFESRRQPRTQAQRGVPNNHRRTNVAANVPVQFHAKPDLFIPFDLSAQANTVSEVRLYMSEQQGRDWILNDTQSPRAKGFQFRAPRDGEYWFAVRTTDASGRQSTEDPTTPEMRLIIDSQKPQLDVRMKADGQGNIAADWIVEDTNLAAHTFSVYFRDERGQWRQVNVETPDQNDSRQRWRSSARFEAPPASREIEVVVEVKDKAKNTVRKQQIVNVDGSQSSRETSPSFSQFGRDSSVRSAAAGGQGTAGNGRSTWQNLFGGVQHANTASHGASRQRTQPQFNGNRSQPGDTFGSRSTFSRVSASGSRPDATESVADSTRRTEANRSNYTNSNFYPPGERPRITSSPNFEIDYELQGVGQRGARRVELWFTRDGGRNWELYGADRDGKSPMEVRLNNEGMYGFRLTVHGYNSPAPLPPQDNEPADIWVAADWTKPVGRITRTKLREQDTTQPYAGNGRELVINYVAEDALLERRPISINFGGSPDGPWYPVVESTDNSGSFTWKLDRRLPEPLYLELQVRDVAGNVTSTVFDAGAATTTGRPAVRIRGIRPFGRSASSRSNTQSPFDTPFSR